MSKVFVKEYVDFLNSLNIILENDNIRFVVKRKHFVFPPDQLGAIVEKCHISIVIDGRDYFFAVVYANPSTRKMRIKYNQYYLDEILMCIGGEFTEFYELNINELHFHVWKFNKKYFKQLIHRIIVKQKRERVEAILLGLTEREVRGLVICFNPIWALETDGTGYSREASETTKAIRSIVADLYGDKVAQLVPVRPRKSVNGYDVFTIRDTY